MKTKKIQKPFSLEAYKNGVDVETKTGHPVRILCTDAETNFPIVGLVNKGQGDNYMCRWTTQGYPSEESSGEVLVIVEPWTMDENAEGEGWYIGSDSKIIQGTNYLLNTSDNLNVFATKKLAKSALAMARISQILTHDERYGGVVTDKEWKNPGMTKYTLERHEDAISCEFSHSYYRFLAFHTYDQRNLFLQYNKQLVKDYLMID